MALGDRWGCNKGQIMSDDRQPRKLTKIAVKTTVPCASITLGVIGSLSVLHGNTTPRRYSSRTELIFLGTNTVYRDPHIDTSVLIWLPVVFFFLWAFMSYRY